MSTQSPFAPNLGVVVEAGQDDPLDDLSPKVVAELLNQHGAVLFRGFGGGLDGFKAFSSRLSRDFSDYRGGGLRFGPLDREAIGGDRTVLSVTGASQGFGIPLHGEMYYMPEPPEVLWFYCDRAPKEGGQTTIADAVALEQGLSAETRDYLKTNRILYRRLLGSEDWRKTFLTEDLSEAERFCRDQGLNWTHDQDTDSVAVDYVTDAFLTGADGVSLFLNNIQFVQVGEDAFNSGWIGENLKIQLKHWPFVVRNGAGDPLPRAILEDIDRAAEAATHEINWQSGDIALVDNRRVLHGRRSNPDSERMILVRMSDGLKVAA